MVADTIWFSLTIAHATWPLAHAGFPVEAGQLPRYGTLFLVAKIATCNGSRLSGDEDSRGPFIVVFPIGFSDLTLTRWNASIVSSVVGAVFANNRNNLPPELRTATSIAGFDGLTSDRPREIGGEHG